MGPASSKSASIKPKTIKIVRNMMKLFCIDNTILAQNYNFLLTIQHFGYSTVKLKYIFTKAFKYYLN